MVLINDNSTAGILEIDLADVASGFMVTSSDNDRREVLVNEGNMSRWFFNHTWAAVRNVSVDR